LIRRTAGAQPPISLRPEVGIAAAERVEVAGGESARHPTSAAAACDDEHRESHTEQPERKPLHAFAPDAGI